MEGVVSLAEVLIFEIVAGRGKYTGPNPSDHTLAPQVPDPPHRVPPGLRRQTPGPGPGPVAAAVLAVAYPALDRGGGRPGQWAAREGPGPCRRWRDRPGGSAPARG